MTPERYGISIQVTRTVTTSPSDPFRPHTPPPQLEFATPEIHRTPRTLDGNSQVSSLYTPQGSSSGSPALPTATTDPGIEKAPQKQKSFHHAGFPMIPTLPPPQSHSRDNSVASPSTTASNSAGDAASISDTKCGWFSRGPATGWRKRLFSSSLFGSRSASQALSPQEDKQFILNLPVDSDHVGCSGLLSQTTLSPSSFFWDESTPVVSIYVPQSILSPAESLEVEANMQDAFNSERYRDYPVVSSSTAADGDDDPTLERLAALYRDIFPTPYSWTQINLHDEGTDVRTQIQSLLRDLVHPWRTVDLLSPSAEAVVMDVLQQELDDSSCPDEYRTVCMKCIQTLSKARNIVPSSFSCRDVIREGENPVWGGGFSVSAQSAL
ncbi:hypothetical protein EV421DRAFT_604140 [Armillaria borealis]|uniref:Uncharacterized protein n=1 Tax=Armillaria borealis TaxID=47425 RepID=A0AA39M5M9_9AGAR|nr:hypothetical protein EV421DRAFT_604140 [Armillaria borealis]